MSDQELRNFVDGEPVAALSGQTAPLIDPSMGEVFAINTHIPLVAEMPHGGFKHSGYGKDLSMYGLEDYTRIKHVMTYVGS